MRKSIEIFPAQIEKIYLTAPFFFILIIIADLIFSVPLINNERVFAYFLTQTIFLNGIHIYFTFAFLMKLPEGRQWVKNSSENNPLFWILPIIVLFSLTFLFAHRFTGDLSSPIFTAYIIITLLGPSFHGVQQKKGLSLIYLRLAHDRAATIEEKSEIKKIEENERSSYLGFIIFFAAYLIFAASQRLNMALEANLIILLTRGAQLLYSLFLVRLIYLSIISYRYCGMNKVIYAARLLPFFFVPYSFYATLALAASHGLEYLGVYFTFSNRSTISKSALQNFYLLTLAMLAVGILLQTTRHFDGLTFLAWDTLNEIPLAVKILAAVSLGLTYLHYYLDGVMFRFSNKDSREAFLPMFMPQKVKRDA